jgi:hypothetical protein
VIAANYLPLKWIIFECAPDAMNGYLVLSGLRGMLGFGSRCKYPLSRRRKPERTGLTTSSQPRLSSGLIHHPRRKTLQEILETLKVL